MLAHYPSKSIQQGMALDASICNFCSPLVEACSRRIYSTIMPLGAFHTLPPHVHPPRDDGSPQNPGGTVTK